MPNTYEAMILELLSQRQPGKSICPSEILQGKDKQNSMLMEEVRRAAVRLALDGQIVITQKNRTIDPQHIRGPIRLRLKE